jgi:hypothetical protein
MPVMVPAIIAASVAFVVAILTPTLTSWRARRQAVADLFDDAVTALLVAQTSRHYPGGGLAPAYTAKWTEEERHQFDVEIAQSGVRRYLQWQEDARVALARLEPFIPEVRQEVTEGWEIKEDNEPTIRKMIDARRHSAIKSERLFRLRRPPRALPEA